MSTCNEHHLAAFHHRLLGNLKRIRNASNTHSLDSDYYIALGLISAAVALGAISTTASDNLLNLALNASEYGSRELRDQNSARRQSAAQGAAA